MEDKKPAPATSSATAAVAEEPSGLNVRLLDDGKDEAAARVAARSLAQNVREESSDFSRVRQVILSREITSSFQKVDPTFGELGSCCCSPFLPELCLKQSRNLGATFQPTYILPGLGRPVHLHRMLHERRRHRLHRPCVAQSHKRRSKGSLRQRHLSVVSVSLVDR